MATTAPMVMVQQNPEEKRRQALATAMMGGAVQYRPMRTGWEALGSLANAYVGAKMGKAADESYEKRRGEARQTLADALTARETGILGPREYGSGDEAFYDVLSMNPDTADLAAQMQLNQILNQQTALTQTPNYIKIPWANSPTGMAYADKRAPNIPVAPAPPGSQGLKVDFNEGQLSGISFGGQQVSPAGEVSAPTSTMTSQVQQKAFNTNESLTRLNSVQDVWKPEYNEIPTRIGMAWDAALAKFGAGNLTEEEGRKLGDYGTARKRAINNLNVYFNEISGAAVSPDEAVRLTQGLPNPGTGWFDGDDPYTFAAGLKDGIRNGRRALIRYNMWMKMGDYSMNPWEIMGIDQVDDYINQKAAQYEQQMAGQYDSEQQLREAVKARLKQEGLAF